MAHYELVMPKLGESIVEATIIRWLKQPGDLIEQDEAVLEIATDKVDSEVPSPVAGILKEIKYKEGDVVPVGKVIAILETESEKRKEQPVEPTPEVTVPSDNSRLEEPISVSPVVETVAVKSPSSGNGHTQKQVTAESTAPHFSEYLLKEPVKGRFYSPLVLNIARKEGIPMEILDRIPGTGEGGRVTKKDILSFLKVYKAQGEVAVQEKVAEEILVKEVEVEETYSDSWQKPAQEPVIESTIPPKIERAKEEKVEVQRTYSVDGDVEIIEMNRMRKIIAENMIASKRTSAHVTSFVEADVTNLVLWRERVKDAFFKKYGTKLTYTHVFVEILAKVLREMPMLNASVDGDKILIKKRIHIGVAVALPDDNLIVPVVRDADCLNLVGIAKVVNDLTERARKGNLKPDEIQGGTYTLSNVGTFGNVMGTPIILQPQVAILATGAIRKKPAVIETPQGDFIGIRYMMFLSHTYDHRIIDGALGGRFVRRVADLLEQWDINREI